ncbi:uncharacterized protein LOC114750221 [Neltuma alba]|uniref:uncharacterized protein LOC114750221 n=1 Tax=Neltuma alba TaxID=207710 RepID=UPI0010A35371|nr:uncharacterized protein LOC114750221 [Prosopis alba]
MLDPARHQPANSSQSPNRTGSSIHGYGRWEDRRSSGFWASKQVDDDDNDSGICSPPLWKTSPTRSPQFDKNYYQSLSPSSRTQAIARGQRELMEMVRNMPESTYELTLKDLVEKPTLQAGEENEKEEKNLINKNAYRREGSGSSSGRKVDQKAAAMRSGKIQSGGFYLKMMMFPPSLGSTTKKKKKKSESSGNEGSKATLRPSISEGSLKGIVDKEWWKKSPSAASGDSESGATSINSGSTKSSGSSSSGSSRNSSRRERSVGSCWFLIGKPKRLTRK